jgi:hypothetical protein
MTSLTTAQHLKRAEDMSHRSPEVLRLASPHVLRLALIGLLVTPLWFDGGLGPERVVAQSLEAMTLPAPASVVRRQTPVSAEELEASRLMMAGTMLVGLAAVVRRAM